MRMAIFAVLLFALLACAQPAVFAAELLDVKPVVTGSSVAIEIAADIPMTYTYYKVPGQARAIVDIAEADPEKIEPLIVVNKGAVSSISVDKAQISGIVVSRIIFNLVSEADIFVSASPDRKLLSVTFGTSAAANKPEQKPDPKPVQLPEPVVKAELPAPAAPTPPAVVPKGDDPLGLDEPDAKTVAPLAKTAAIAVASEIPPPVVAPTITRVPKLEPVVPVAVSPARASALSIKEIVAGDSYIEIRTSQPATDYKSHVITGPERLVIDIPGAKINQKPKSVTINKFGVTKARIGISPKNIRIVIDSAKAGFPAHTISTTDEGLRVNFK